MSNLRTLYNKNLDLQFYHIPKNGMTTVLYGIGGFEWIPLSDLPKSAKTFCVLRDPYKRAVSSFGHFFFYERCQNIPEQTLREFTNEKISAFLNAGFSIRGFELFLLEIKNNGIFNNHNRPQSYFLSGNQDHILTFPEQERCMYCHRSLDNIDTFYNIESLNSEFSKKHNVTNTSVKNQGLFTHEQRKLLLTAAMGQFKEIIEEIYGIDVDSYNKYIK